MSSNHERWSNGPYPEHGQDKQERRSAQRPYEWYDQDQSSGPSRQYEPYYRESSSHGYRNWPQYGYDDQMYEQYQQNYGAANAQSSTYNDDSRHSSTSERSRNRQSDGSAGTKGPPRRSVPSSSKSVPSSSKASQARWHLSKEFQAFVRNSRTDTLLLLDDYCRPLSASKEMFSFLQSLPNLSAIQNRIRGVITASKDGRWLALVACHDADVAKALANEIKDHAKDIEAKFVTNEVFNSVAQGQKVTLAEGLRKRFSEEGVLIDEWSSTATVKPAAATLPGKEIDHQFELPGSVSRDHRKITSANPSSYAKKAASHISRWNAQQEEMQRNDVVESSAIPEPQHDSNDPSNDVQVSKEFNYLDEEKKACLLCQRQFKTLEVLKRHSIESELHKKNLQDQDRCSEGRKRKIASIPAQDVGSTSSTGMKKAGFAPVQRVTSNDRYSAASEDKPTAESGMEYRDRAAERRIVFGTEAIAKAKAMAKKRPYSGESTVKTTPASEDAIPAKLDETSIGGALLAKMGWTSGKGLGIDGEGRIDPIVTHVYTPGAGIGSGGSNKSAPTVEEYSSRHTKFIQGDAAYQRSVRMQERYKE
ncbi:uncharacterized protein FA14DRAFT_162063 [Meira miltonrushii]|uniref:G-patch domain-containing protein n=1 Tax=Meira miltonrushii TaxID=1280837 RepID=A0A316V5I2_9BASI|nr:uncharacterized protein FA14DRAFT_162063 [Meira miltonrushii]PWN32776.1 hypothetical protein FA14DRAFT_162063 [Meira miltonrushii]